MQTKSKGVTTQMKALDILMVPFVSLLKKMYFRAFFETCLDREHGSGSVNNKLLNYMSDILDICKTGYLLLKGRSNELRYTCNLVKVNLTTVT